MIMSWNIADESAMDTLAACLAPHLRDGDVVLLDGDLGAGKTRFVKGIAAALGSPDIVTSPTFNIMQEYATESLSLIHFDLYRLDDPEQLEDVDFHASVDESTPGASFVEWAGKFPADMPEDSLRVTILVDGLARRVEARAGGMRSQQLLDAWTACDL